MNKNNKLICFDYDGVLADSRAMVIASVFEAMASLGLECRLTAQGLATLEETTFPEIGRLAGVPANLIEVFLSRLFLLFLRKDKLVPIFPEIPALVAKLAEEHTLIVLSASPASAIDASLKHGGLSSHFCDILGADVPGTKAEKLTQLLAARRGEQDNTWMIGDAASDIRAARQAGVRSAAVLWGWQEREMLVGEGPTLVANVPGDLNALL